MTGLAVETLSDSSKFPEEWLFKHRWGKGKKDAPNKLPNGEKIVFLTVGGRTSAVVPSVQKKTGPVAGDAKSGAKEGGKTAKSGPKSAPKAGDKRKRKVVVKRGAVYDSDSSSGFGDAVILNDLIHKEEQSEDEEEEEEVVKPKKKTRAVTAKKSAVAVKEEPAEVLSRSKKGAKKGGVKAAPETIPELKALAKRTSKKAAKKAAEPVPANEDSGRRRSGRISRHFES